MDQAGGVYSAWSNRDMALNEIKLLESFPVERWGKQVFWLKVVGCNETAV